jgi:hypothetical protein
MWLAEAFLALLHAAGLPGRQAALAFRLIYDYTLGFALADPASPGGTRRRSFTPSRYPVQARDPGPDRQSHRPPGRDHVTAAHLRLQRQ